MEIKVSIGGSTIPEDTDGLIVPKTAGGRRDTFEADFGVPGTAICDKNDLRVIKE